MKRLVLNKNKFLRFLELLQPQILTLNLEFDGQYIKAKARETAGRFMYEGSMKYDGEALGCYPIGEIDFLKKFLKSIKDEDITLYIDKKDLVIKSSKPIYRSRLKSPLQLGNDLLNPRLPEHKEANKRFDDIIQNFSKNTTFLVDNLKEVTDSFKSIKSQLMKIIQNNNGTKILCLSSRYTLISKQKVEIKISDAKSDFDIEMSFDEILPNLLNIIKEPVYFNLDKFLMIDFKNDDINFKYILIPLIED